MERLIYSNWLGGDRLYENPVSQGRESCRSPHIETCPACGGAVQVATPAHPCARGMSASMQVIACIEDPVVIQKILTQLREKTAPEPLRRLPSARVPPTGLFG